MLEFNYPFNRPLQDLQSNAMYIAKKQKQGLGRTKLSHRAQHASNTLLETITSLNQSGAEKTLNDLVQNPNVFIVSTWQNQ